MYAMYHDPLRVRLDPSLFAGTAHIGTCMCSTYAWTCSMRWTGQVKNLGNELHRPGCEANVDHTVLSSPAKKSRNNSSLARSPLQCTEYTCCIVCTPYVCLSRFVPVLDKTILGILSRAARLVSERTLSICNPQVSQTATAAGA